MLVRVQKSVTRTATTATVAATPSPAHSPRLEAGFAYLFTGGFRDDAPGSNAQGDTAFLYTQATLRF